MKTIGGARGAFRSNCSNFSNPFHIHSLKNFYLNANVPSASTVTYEGLFNSTFFKLNSKEEKKQ